MLPKRTKWERNIGDAIRTIEDLVGPELWFRLRALLPGEFHVQDGLIATASARDNPLLIQGHLDAATAAPIGYGLAGFWGHGINSHAFYFQTVAAGRRMFARLPYGGMFMNNAECRRDIKAYLSSLLDFESLDLSAGDTFTAIESMGWGYYRCELPAGAVYEVRDSLCGLPDVRGCLKRLKDPANLAIEGVHDSSIRSNAAFWRAMNQRAEGNRMAQRFVDDDRAYRQWVACNPEGFVLNTERNAGPGYLILHRAVCRHIAGFVAAHPTSTDYAKTCGSVPNDLRAWARRETGGEPRACRICDPLDQRAAVPAHQD